MCSKNGKTTCLLYCSNWQCPGKWFKKRVRRTINCIICVLSTLQWKSGGFGASALMLCSTVCDLTIAKIRARLFSVATLSYACAELSVKSNGQMDGWREYSGCYFSLTAQSHPMHICLTSHSYIHPRTCHSILRHIWIVMARKRRKSSIMTIQDPTGWRSYQAFDVQLRCETSRVRLPHKKVQTVPLRAAALYNFRPQKSVWHWKFHPLVWKQ